MSYGVYLVMRIKNKVNGVEEVTETTYSECDDSPAMAVQRLERAMVLINERINMIKGVLDGN